MLLGTYIFQIVPNCKSLRNLYPYYREILLAWKRITQGQFCRPITRKEILLQPLFQNPLICDDQDKTFFNRNFIDGGIIRVGDLMYEIIPTHLPAEAVYECIALANPDNTLSVKEVQDVISNLIKAFPSEWLEAIYSSDVIVSSQPDPNCGIRFMNGSKHIDASGITCQIASNLLRSVNTSIPKGESYWNTTFPDTDFENRWSNIYRFPKMFHDADLDFKVMHNILYTNEKLYKFSIIDSPSCVLCRTASESLSHLFIDCVKVNTMWNFIVTKLGKVYKANDLRQWRIATLLGTGLNRKKLEGTLIDYIFNLYKNTIWSYRCSQVCTSNDTINNYSVNLLTLFHVSLKKKLNTIFQVYKKMHRTQFFFDMFGQENVVIRYRTENDFSYNFDS